MLACKLESLPNVISERLLKLRIDLWEGLLATIISAYAPTMTYTDEVKEVFYKDLDGTLREIPRGDKLIILGDIKSRVGNDSNMRKNVIGKHEVGKTNAKELLLWEKCSQHGLVITNTVFQQADKYKTSWMHPTYMQCRPVGRGSRAKNIVKDVKWYKTNVVVVGLAIWMHFQQLEDLKFLFFWGNMTPDLPKTLAHAECLPVPNSAALSRFFLRIPTRLHSWHGENPNFEDQLSQANEQRNIFLLNHRNICHKMKKTFNLDIPVNSELQSCWITQELQNKITKNLLACSIERLSNFPAFLNQTFCCYFDDPFTPWHCETLITYLFFSDITVNSRSVNEQKIKVHCAHFGPW